MQPTVTDDADIKYVLSELLFLSFLLAPIVNRADNIDQDACTQRMCFPLSS